MKKFISIMHTTKGAFSIVSLSIRLCNSLSQFITASIETNNVTKFRNVIMDCSCIASKLNVFKILLCMKWDTFCAKSFGYKPKESENLKQMLLSQMNWKDWQSESAKEVKRCFFCISLGSFRIIVTKKFNIKKINSVIHKVNSKKILLFCSVKYVLLTYNFYQPKLKDLADVTIKKIETFFRIFESNTIKEKLPYKIIKLVIVTIKFLLIARNHLIMISNMLECHKLLSFLTLLRFYTIFPDFIIYANNSMFMNKTTTTISFTIHELHFQKIHQDLIIFHMLFIDQNNKWMFLSDTN